MKENRRIPNQQIRNSKSTVWMYFVYTFQTLRDEAFRPNIGFLDEGRKRFRCGMKARHMRLSEEQSVCLTNNGKSYLTWSDTFSLTDFVSQNFNSIRQSVEKIEIKIV